MEDTWERWTSQLFEGTPCDFASASAALKLVVIGCETCIEEIRLDSPIGNLLPDDVKRLGRLHPFFASRPLGVAKLLHTLVRDYGGRGHWSTLTIADVASLLAGRSADSEATDRSVLLQDRTIHLSAEDLLTLAQRRDLALCGEETSLDARAGNSEILAVIEDWSRIPHGLLRPQDLLPIAPKDALEIGGDVRNLSHRLASDYGWPKLNVSLGIDAAYAAGIIPPTTAPRSYVRLDWFVGLLRWLYCRERKTVR